ncbi:MAG: hypothetical protein LBR16_00210 [Treponema sp.]|jgi:hypothetical protein|nr:hypothetical protein [Treponema sp.]
MTRKKYLDLPEVQNFIGWLGESFSQGSPRLSDIIHANWLLKAVLDQNAKSEFNTVYSDKPDFLVRKRVRLLDAALFMIGGHIYTLGDRNPVETGGY